MHMLANWAFCLGCRSSSTAAWSFAPSHTSHVSMQFDSNYYMETPQGGMMPNRTWTFCGEITSDQLSQVRYCPHLGCSNHTVACLRVATITSHMCMHCCTLSCQTSIIGSRCVISWARAQAYCSTRSREAWTSVNCAQATPCSSDMLTSKPC